VGKPHLVNRRFRCFTLEAIEPVVRRLQIACAGPFPFVRIAQALTFGLADQRRLARLHPHDGVSTWNVWKLELIDASLGVLGSGRFRVEEWNHVFGTTNLLELGIVVLDGLTVQHGGALLRRDRMPRDGGISLPDDLGLREYRSNFPDLRVAQSMNLLQLLQQKVVLLRQGNLR